MGFLDKMQAKAAEIAAWQQQQAETQMAAAFPPGTVTARVDQVSLSPVYRGTTVQAYIATLDLQPEDVFGILPQHNNDVTMGYEFVYRDSPRYESGRQAWAAAHS